MLVSSNLAQLKKIQKGAGIIFEVFGNVKKVARDSFFLVTSIICFSIKVAEIPTHNSPRPLLAVPKGGITFLFTGQEFLVINCCIAIPE